MLRTILTYLGLSLFGLVAAVLLLELGFRLLIRTDKHASWDDRPKFYFSDQRASTLQDYGYTDTKPAGTIRVAVIGDSFSFAPYMQFDDTYAKRLERWLNLNASQPKVEVINYGVPGYSSSHEVPVVAKAIRAGADLIILQITLNDPEIKPLAPTALSPRAVEIARFGEVNLDSGLYRHWRSLAFVATRIMNERSREEYKRYYFSLFSRKPTWANFSNALTNIAHYTQRRKVKVLAVIFPLFGFPNDQSYPFTQIHKQIHKLLKRLRLPYLELLPHYYGIPLERMVVMPGRDRHPNEIGHRIAAEAIYARLAKGRFLPRKVLAKERYISRIGITKKTEELLPNPIEKH